MELDIPSPVKVRVASTRHLQKMEVDPTSLDPCSKDVPTGRCLRPRKQKQKRPQKESQQRLTRTPVNRKRPRAQSNEEAHETPQAKRRSVRPPVSTSLSRRLLPLSRRLSSTSVPYAERLRRRQAERQGRIHTTVFRLPELVAQNEADRLASENQPSSPSPYPPAPQTSFDFPETPGLSRTFEEQSSLQEPRTPETPSGWNIRGLLSSVPRSFSRFIPRFGRSHEGTDGSGMFLPSPSFIAFCWFSLIKNEQTKRTSRSHLVNLAQMLPISLRHRPLLFPLPRTSHLRSKFSDLLSLCGCRVDAYALLELHLPKSQTPKSQTCLTTFSLGPLIGACIFLRTLRQRRPTRLTEVASRV